MLTGDFLVYVLDFSRQTPERNSLKEEIFYVGSQLQGSLSKVAFVEQSITAERLAGAQLLTSQQPGSRETGDRIYPLKAQLLKSASSD